MTLAHESSRSARLKAERLAARMALNLTCPVCSGPVPHDRKRTYCGESCARLAKLKQQAELRLARGIRAREKRPPAFCETCFDLPHRRPRWRPCACGKLFAADVIDGSEFLYGESNLARAQDQAPGYVGTWAYGVSGFTPEGVKKLSAWKPTRKRRAA